MKYLLCLSISMLGLITGYAQTLRITDNITGEPVENCDITLACAQQQLQEAADDKGAYTLPSNYKECTFTFTCVGYKPLTISGSQLEVSGFSVSMTPSAYPLSGVTVSASRFSEPVQDVPRQVLILKSRDMQFINQNTTAHLLEQTGQVLVQSSQAGGGSPVIRGFEANKVLLVIDGVRMNNAIYRGGHLQNVMSIDNSMLDKAEIVFGPGSVIYGSDALGGVMHFYTRKPLFSRQGGSAVSGSAFTRYSSAYDEKTGHADVNIGLKNVAFLTAFTYSDFGDVRQGNIRNPFYGNWGKREYYAQRIGGKDSMIKNSDPNVQVGSGYTQYDFMQKVRIRQNANIEHLLNFQYSTSSDLPRYDRLTDFRNGKLRFGQWYYGPQKRMFGSYTMSLYNMSKLFNNANIILAYQDIEESRHDRNWNSNNLNHRTEKVKVMSLNADFEKRIKKHELRYGAEVLLNDVQSTANVENINDGRAAPLSTRYPDGGSDMNTWALYFTHAIELSPKWMLSEGVRYSNVTLSSTFNDKTFFPFPFSSIEQKNSALNGNVGVVYQPGRDWRFSALASTGFRAPNVDDMSKVFESVAGNLIVPNPDLKAERTYNAEMTIAKTIMKQVTISGTAFYSAYRDALTTQKSQFSGQDSIVYNGAMSGVYTTVNAGEAYLYGFSGTLSADVTKHFSIVSTVNYTYGRITSTPQEVPLDHIAPAFGRTSFNLALNRFRGEFFVLWNAAKKPADYNPSGEDNQSYSANPVSGYTPAWMTLNIRTSYQVHKALQIQAALENILDQNYRVFASGISSPGRNLVLTLRGRF